MKDALKGVGAAGLAVLAVLAIIVVGALIYVFAATVGGEADKAANPGREKSVLFDPNNSIGRYEQFYDDCQAYLALTPKVKLAEEELAARRKGYEPKTDTFGEERKAIERLAVAARGLRNQQIDIAAQYNADSAKTTRAQFKAADLPYQLDEETASCGDSKEAGR